MRKNIEITPATELTSPNEMNTIAMTNVSMEALYGSRFFPFPRDSMIFIFLNGIVLSAAMACRVRGATIIAPIAEDDVQAASPKGMTILP